MTRLFFFYSNLLLSFVSTQLPCTINYTLLWKINQHKVLASLPTEFLRKHETFYKVNIGSFVLNDAKAWWEYGGRILLLGVRIKKNEAVLYKLWGKHSTQKKQPPCAGIEMAEILAYSTNLRLLWLSLRNEGWQVRIVWEIGRWVA